MQARHVRTLRGITAAAVATWIAAVSHTLGGGTAPSALLLLVVTALAAPSAVALAGRRLGLARLTLTVLVTQVLLHVSFAWTAGLDPSAAAPHAHGAPVALTSDVTVVLPDVTMTLAHLVAAAATIAVIHRGERVLRAVARGIRAMVSRLIPRLTVPVRLVPARPSARPVAPVRPFFSSVLSRRGPPAFVAAAL